MLWRITPQHAYTMYITLEDRILIELHRAGNLSGRPGIVVPSIDLSTVKERLGNQRVRDALKRLVHSGRVLSVRHDLLVLPDATGRVTVGITELIDVVAPAPYLITGGRALEVHRLTDQHSFSVVTLVPRPVLDFTFRGEKAVFSTARDTRIWGWVEDGPHIALPERALIDAVRSSDYGVPLSMAIAALHSAVARDSNFTNKLARSARRFDSAAVSRRLGLLVESCCGHEAAEPFRDLLGTSRTPVLLRPGGLPSGKIDTSWRVVINATTQLESIQ
jgi:predicted transcriptional regulator of viral defense system